MSNKLKPKNPTYTFFSDETIPKQCHHCEKDGEILIKERSDKGLVKITNKYYLCKPCFLNLLTPKCPECEENNQPYQLDRDTERLEITCLNCGTVLASLITEEHHEKRDYTVNRPTDLNKLDSIECVTYIIKR